MDPTHTIVGTLVSGRGEAAGFTTFDWVREAFIDVCGIDPHPGTVNLVPRSTADRDAWADARSRAGLLLAAQDPAFCDARCYPARVAGAIDAAVVVPEVDGYPVDQIELVAAVNVRDALGLDDGEPVTIEVFAGAAIP